MTPTKTPRPKILQGTTTKVQTACGNIYITVSMHNGAPFEIFATLGKAGGCSKCQLEALTRCISSGLRYGIPIEEYIKQLENLKCPNGMYQQGDEELYIHSCPDAIAWVLKTVTNKESIRSEYPTQAKGIQPTVAPKGSTYQYSNCPDCGGALVFQEGCETCPSCGYSKCG